MSKLTFREEAHELAKDRYKSFLLNKKLQSKSNIDFTAKY